MSERTLKGTYHFRQLQQTNSVIHICAKQNILKTCQCHDKKITKTKAVYQYSRKTVAFQYYQVTDAPDIWKSHNTTL